MGQLGTVAVHSMSTLPMRLTMALSGADLHSRTEDWLPPDDACDTVSAHPRGLLLSGSKHLGKRPGGI